ncbi:MAG: hypothetical protein HQK75_16685 [Candidatus Magnetomorum sp.]|nr:hypothetical protein [Candidatus Magnetomorum sp.]
MNRFFRWVLILLICLSLYDIKIRFDQYTSHASAFLSGLFSNFSSKDLAIIDRFALHTSLHRVADASLEEQTVYAIAFNMLVMEGRILDHKQIIERMGNAYPVTMDRKKFFKAVDYWKKRFDANPGFQKIVYQIKKKLIHAAKRYPFFHDVRIQLYVDTAKKEGFFKDTLVKALDSIPWWQRMSTYCGMKYPVKEQDLRKHTIMGISQEYGSSFVLLGKKVCTLEVFHSTARWDVAGLILDCSSFSNYVSLNIPLKPFVVAIVPGLWMCISGMILLGVVSARSRKKHKKINKEQPPKIGPDGKNQEKKDGPSNKQSVLTEKEMDDRIDTPNDQKKLLFQTS